MNAGEAIRIWALYLNHLSLEDCLEVFKTGVDSIIYSDSFESNIDGVVTFLTVVDFRNRLYCFKHGVPEDKNLKFFVKYLKRII